jgi:hypothetical protein
MNLELSPEEARFLNNQLVRHLEAMENELVHTDKHQLQREIARDVEKMKVIHERLATLAAGRSAVL